LKPLDLLKDGILVIKRHEATKEAIPSSISSKEGMKNGEIVLTLRFG